MTDPGPTWNQLPVPYATPLTLLEHPEWQAAGVQVLLKRDDLLFLPSHPEICGNKWRKLWGTLRALDGSGKNTMVTMGGPHSNHLVALAAAGNLLGLRTTGWIRGEWLAGESPTLDRAVAYGMAIRFLSRDAYRQLRTAPPEFLAAEAGDSLFVPEGGTNGYSDLGMESLMREMTQEFPEEVLRSGTLQVAVPVGTGGTLRGMNRYNDHGLTLLAIPVLRGMDLPFTSNRIVWAATHHLGGYARYHAGMVTFMTAFYDQHGVVLDPIYTGKMMYALDQLIRSGHFPGGTKVLAIHTGGLQGIHAFNRRFGCNLPLPEVV